MLEIINSALNTRTMVFVQVKNPYHVREQTCDFFVFATNVIQNQMCARGTEIMLDVLFSMRVQRQISPRVPSQN